MDYQLGLRMLKAHLPGDALGELNVYEARLLENLHRERLYGGTEATRADRAAIVDALNQLAQVHIGTSFNALCQTAPTSTLPEPSYHHAEMRDEQELASLHHLLTDARAPQSGGSATPSDEPKRPAGDIAIDSGGGAVIFGAVTVEDGDFAGRDAVASVASGATAPPVLSGTAHVLSFDRLSPLDFERLCLWLVEREGYTHAGHLGLAGSEQGRDVIAYRPTPHGEELWYFQCKRYRSISARALKDEVAKYLRLAEEKPRLLPTGVVFVLSCAVSARVREEVAAYCKGHGLAHEFWALTELDMRVKRHPDLLREFFNLVS